MNTNPFERERIQSEAAKWVARLSSDAVTPEERRSFALWVEAAPEHRRAFFAMRERWQMLGQAARRQASSPLKRADFSVFSKVAAALMLCAGLGAFYPDARDALLADAATATGERKELRLADGSTLYLNTDTAVALEFNGARRGLRLLHGEAEVSVAHDPSRPLVLRSGSYQATALGTRFSLSDAGEALTLTVFESKVKFSKGERVIDEVEPGQQLTTIPGGRVIKRAVSPQEAEAWREGKLVFTARPMREVIAEINRYRKGRVFLFSREVPDRPVSGVFDIDRLDDSLPVIAESMGLKPVRLGSYLVALY